MAVLNFLEFCVHVIILPLLCLALICSLPAEPEFRRLGFTGFAFSSVDSPISELCLALHRAVGTGLDENRQ